MSDSRTPEEGSAGSDDGPQRPPRYEQVIRWAEYIKTQPPEVWGPQQNAVVNGQIESAQAVDVNFEERIRLRDLADEILERNIIAVSSRSALVALVVKNCVYIVFIRDNAGTHSTGPHPFF
ncbi:hypothetical protein [Halorubrum ezzemoulense]|uniref:hypothetical protein n=1 Tax=Halorubrum ezzemoulense TaxID=337243 RepID=UPI00211B0D5A|nr:hypothetical protein [Halorubrum ezzemoulense]